MGVSKFGYVIGTAMQKTIKVRVENIKVHPVVQKPVRYHKNFLAHDETEQCVVGDYVRIDECAKLSKLKHFTLGEVVRPAKRVVDPFGKLHTEPVFQKEAPAHYNLENYKY
ncbi:hypothetical protein HDU91_007492 [Kappamyces sp. JEL0680]|nr:hypothetical protein HDU91_007492 [Kappamyces sp. JEL0680]